jgi:membrane-associated phospholipid phosphatase
VAAFEIFLMRGSSAHAGRSPGRCWRALLLVAGLCAHAAVNAACTGDGARGGILGLDRCDEFEATGIFARKYQKLLGALVIGGTAGVALWEGTQSPAGRTAWESLDSMAITGVTTEVMKNVFRRPRPTQSSDPDLWRQGHGNKSFPSGETAMMAAFVTPIIIDYQEEHPAVWALSILPAYMGVARMGSQAHWLSDVVAGAAVGVLVGTYTARRDSPLLLELTEDGVFVGFKHRF